MEHPLFKEQQHTPLQESTIEAFRRKKAERQQLLAGHAVERTLDEDGRSYGQIVEESPYIPENYERFTSDHQPVTYRDSAGLHVEKSGVWEDRYVAEQYIHEADGLIGRLDGTITKRDSDGIYDERIEVGEPRIPDTVLWLDKSARPVSWITDAFFDEFAKPGAKKPDYEFLNIDRANWFTYLGHSSMDAESRLGPEDFNIDDVDPDRIAAIRAYFTEGDLDESTWKDDVWNMKTRLDGKHLLIVDEVKNKGGTLHIAVELLRKAIPELTVDGSYFWHTSRVSINGTSAEKDDQQMATAPLWYNKTRVEGRDVDEINPAYHNHQYRENPNQQTLRDKIASFAKSPPLHNPKTYEPVQDKLAQKFKQDIAMMTYDLANGNLFRMPSSDRDEDDFFAIMERQGLSREEAVTYIRGRGARNRDQRS